MKQKRNLMMMCWRICLPVTRNLSVLDSGTKRLIPKRCTVGPRNSCTLSAREWTHVVLWCPVTSCCPDWDDKCYLSLSSTVFLSHPRQNLTTYIKHSIKFHFDPDSRECTCHPKKTNIWKGNADHTTLDKLKKSLQVYLWTHMTWRWLCILFSDPMSTVT